MFEWMIDPTAWLGLLTLVVLEIVLGIDNLLFIAILAEKLPPEQRDRARYYGLALALLMRFGLLASLSHLVTFTQPLFTIWSLPLSGRDLILLLGGFFLLFKATRELHGRIEGVLHSDEQKKVYLGFWVVVAQIVVLDAVFSLDAVITAVGMSDHLAIMMIAVTIAIVIMMWASKPLTLFINRHPTLVILCLGFLLMIGFSLMADGLGFHVPKGYLYAAIGFSILIEFFNQLARANQEKLFKGKLRRRERTAEMVMSLLGVKPETQPHHEETSRLSEPREEIFSEEEKDMVSRVLQLSSLPIRAVMTVRRDIEMLDLTAPQQDILQLLAQTPHSRLVVTRDNNRDAPLGIIRKRDVLAQLLEDKSLRIDSLIQPALCLPETISVLNALEQFRRAKNYLAFVVDEFGNFEGLVSIRDIMEEIAGKLPETGEEESELVMLAPGSFRVSGDMLLSDLQRELGFPAASTEHYHTLAGWLLEWLQRLPTMDEVIDYEGWQITVTEIRAHRIESVWLTRQQTE
ncbi:TerC family protein [Tolumonas osonensis]|uniref:CBS domain containing-hemolysin-like protein n=1 Tax=Tolumonas osonensis TaxID=675874 RepID=A0A841G5T2_9GAMM|nr:TerC family protein [Tolumonas osonensis]MBB6054188.1 CBS domain containing-hemolysin-like protein [Tolumonas osonensis]